MAARGNDTFTLSGSGSINSLVGNAGTDTLSSAIASTWNITGSNSGNITSILNNFGGMETLNDSSSGTNSFVFPDNINFNGTINGNSTDTLNYSAYASGHAVTATVTGANSGSVLANSITANFTGITSLITGAGNDSFIFSDNASLTGNITAGAGTNLLNISAYTSPVSVNLPSATTTVLDGTFSGITQFIGTDTSAGNVSTLIGSNSTNTWTLSSVNAGSLNSSAIVFSGFGNLTSGTGNNTFNFGTSGSLTGTLSLNAGVSAVNTLTGTVSAGAITTSGSGSTAINASSITTTGAQSYGVASLGSNTTLTSSGGSAITFNNTIAGNGYNVTINTSGSSSIAGVFSDGTGVGSSLTQQGSGTLLLSSVNTYTGATTISAGTIRQGIANAISNSSAVTIAASGTFDLNNVNSAIGSLAGTGTVSLGTAILTVGNDNSSTIFNGLLTGSTSGIIKVGTGTLTLGNNSNSYSGITEISQGTISITAANAIPAASTLQLDAAGTLSLGISKHLPA